MIKCDVIQLHMPIIPALKTWRPEEQDFTSSVEASLGYVSYCPREQTNKQRPRRFHSETMWPVYHQANVLKGRAEGREGQWVGRGSGRGGAVGGAVGGAASVFRIP